MESLSHFLLQGELPAVIRHLIEKKPSLCLNPLLLWNILQAWKSHAGSCVKNLRDFASRGPYTLPNHLSSVSEIEQTYLLFIQHIDQFVPSLSHIIRSLPEDKQRSLLPDAVSKTVLGGALDEVDQLFKSASVALRSFDEVITILSRLYTQPSGWKATLPNRMSNGGTSMQTLPTLPSPQALAAADARALLAANPGFKQSGATRAVPSPPQPTATTALPQAHSDLSNSAAVPEHLTIALALLSPEPTTSRAALECLTDMVRRTEAHSLRAVTTAFESCYAQYLSTLCAGLAPSHAQTHTPVELATALEHMFTPEQRAARDMVRQVIAALDADAAAERVVAEGAQARVWPPHPQPAAVASVVAHSQPLIAQSNGLTAARIQHAQPHLPAQRDLTPPEATSLMPLPTDTSPSPSAPSPLPQPQVVSRNPTPSTLTPTHTPTITPTASSAFVSASTSASPLLQPSAPPELQLACLRAAAHTVAAVPPPPRDGFAVPLPRARASSAITATAAVTTKTNTPTPAAPAPAPVAAPAALSPEATLAYMASLVAAAAAVPPPQTQPQAQVQTMQVQNVAVQPSAPSRNPSNPAAAGAATSVTKNAVCTTQSAQSPPAQSAQQGMGVAADVSATAGAVVDQALQQLFRALAQQTRVGSATTQSVPAAPQPSSSPAQIPMQQHLLKLLLQHQQQRQLQSDQPPHQQPQQSVLSGTTVSQVYDSAVHLLQRHQQLQASFQEQQRLYEQKRLQSAALTPDIKPPSVCANNDTAPETIVSTPALAKRQRASEDTVTAEPHAQHLLTAGMPADATKDEGNTRKVRKLNPPAATSTAALSHGARVQALLSATSAGYRVTAMGIYDLGRSSTGTANAKVRSVPRLVAQVPPVFQGSLADFNARIVTMFPAAVESVGARAASHSMFDFGDMGAAVRKALFGEDMTAETFQLLQRHFHTPRHATGHGAGVSVALPREHALLMHAVLYGVTHLTAHQPQRERLAGLLNHLYGQSEQPVQPLFTEVTVSQWLEDWNTRVEHLRATGELLADAHGGMHVSALLRHCTLFYGLLPDYVPHADVNFGSAFGFFGSAVVRAQMQKQEAPELTFAEKALMQALLEDASERK